MDIVNCHCFNPTSSLDLTTYSTSKSLLMTTIIKCVKISHQDIMNSSVFNYTITKVYSIYSIINVAYNCALYTITNVLFIVSLM